MWIVIVITVSRLIAFKKSNGTYCKRIIGLYVSKNNSVICYVKKNLISDGQQSHGYQHCV